MIHLSRCIFTGAAHYPREAALFVRAEEVAPDVFFEIARKATIMPESEE